MKKLFKNGIVLSALMLVTLGVNAQIFQQGVKQLNLGIGIWNNLLSTGMSTSVPPISASFDYGISDNVSVGGFLGYSKGYLEQDYFSNKWRWDESYIMFGVRGAYHFPTSDQFDPYLGVLIGYASASTTVTKPGSWSGADIAG